MIYQKFNSSYSVTFCQTVNNFDYSLSVQKATDMISKRLKRLPNASVNAILNLYY